MTPPTLPDNPAELHELAKYLINSHFPESIHQDILDVIGLSLDILVQGTSATPPEESNIPDSTI